MEKLKKVLKLKVNTRRARFLIKKFLKERPESYRIFANESSIANRLLKLYPEINFWISLKLDFKLNSLAYFLTYNGKVLLKTEWNRRNLILDFNKPSYKLNDDKIGEDKKIENMGKTLIEILT